MKTVRTWWGRKFIQALEAFTDPARLARGRGYTGSDRIKAWNVRSNQVSATVRGNVNPYYGIYNEPYYQTRVELKTIDASDWSRVIGELGSRAAFVSRLLLNEMPDNIEEPFEALGLHLLPRDAKDLKTDCSCPDWANPCKHVAGLYYFLAARFDQDPFLLFELRGLPREELMKQLRATPLGRVLADALNEQEEPVSTVESYFTRPRPQPLPSAVAAERFWRLGKRLPEQIEPAVPPAVPALLIKKGGDFPEFWTRENSFIETMEACYEAIRKRGKAC
jgi:uncharacterized Zn finger protein